MATLESRVTANETSIKNLRTELNNTKYDLSNEVKKRDTLEANIKENKTNIADNTSRIKDLEKAQENTNIDVRLLKTSQADINKDIIDINKHMEELDENTSNLEKKHTTDLTEVKEELVNLYNGIIAVEDKIGENGQCNCNHNHHDHHPHKPEHSCNCPYCEGSREEEEPIVPSTASIMDKLVAKYLQEHINNLFCTIIPRHDLSTNWTINDPILTLGEYGVEDDTHRIKRGDGTTKWSELPYETFGVETLSVTKANNINYDNSETGLEMYNVQEVLDYLFKVDGILEKDLKLKEEIRNRRENLDDANNTTYPTTKAVVDYVTNRLKDISIGDGNSSLPDIPDETKDYVLGFIGGKLQWIENTSNPAGLEQKVKDLEQQLQDLKNEVDNIIDLDEEEF